MKVDQKYYHQYKPQDVKSCHALIRRLRERLVAIEGHNEHQWGEINFLVLKLASLEEAALTNKKGVV